MTQPLFSSRCATLLVVASLTFAAGAQEAAKAPRAVIADPVVDLGEVTYGTSHDHDFVIENTGDAPLRIHEMQPNCACAVIDFDEEIAPGAEGKISVRFDAELMGGPAAVSIVGVTNDPASPTIKLTLKAVVKVLIDARPGFARYLVVQDFEGDSTLTQTLWSVDGSPLKVTGAETDYDFIETTVRPAKPEELLADIANKEQWKVETRISPNAPVGALKGFLTIHVDHPKQKVVKLPLHGFVRPMFAVTPPEADWGALDLGEQGYETSLHVKNFADEAVALTSAETNVEGITAEVEEAEPGRVYYVKLTYSPDLPKGDFEGVVRIKTQSAKKPLLEVPLKGTIL
jgi:hypothetical protein